MVQVIDRRNSQNKNKSLSNRQRFIDRAKDQIRESVNKKVEKDKLSDLVKGDKVKVKIKNTKEPTFSQDYESGEHDYVVPGNKEFEAGDQIARPKSSKGKGNKAGEDGDGEDDFSFVLTKEEYLSILFEDLELPDMIKKQINDVKNYKLQRQGYTNSGSPSSIDVQKTAKNALGRRIALKRPKNSEIEELKEEIKRLEELNLIDEVCEAKQKLLELIKKQKATPYLDPLDIKYRRFEKIPQPIAHAVMFCIMDVSGSMDENKKDIAKRFFLLLYLFLTRKYESVEVRFVRHTTVADEVDEETFFGDRHTGGTVVSPALKLVDDLITKDYDTSKTNIYVAQASDGDNMYNDNDACYEILTKELINKIQYMAYIEIYDENRDQRFGFRADEDEPDDGLWGYYLKASNLFKQIQCRKIGSQKQIFEVFADLFKRKTDE